MQLLYLVPCCLGGVALIAASQGDLGRVYSFHDTPPAISVFAEDKGEGKESS